MTKARLGVFFDSSISPLSTPQHIHQESMSAFSSKYVQNPATPHHIHCHILILLDYYTSLQMGLPASTSAFQNSQNEAVKM